MQPSLKPGLDVEDPGSLLEVNGRELATDTQQLSPSSSSTLSFMADSEPSMNSSASDREEIQPSGAHAQTHPTLVEASSDAHVRSSSSATQRMFMRPHPFSVRHGPFFITYYEHPQPGYVAYCSLHPKCHGCHG